MAVAEDAATALLRAIGAKFSLFDGAFSVEENKSRSWASVTFTGSRHRLTFSLQGRAANAAADSFIETLTEADFPLRGHVLADIALAGDERSIARERVQLTIEALTVEDS
jgi:hypothetical protein